MKDVILMPNKVMKILRRYLQSLYATEKIRKGGSNILSPQRGAVKACTSTLKKVRYFKVQAAV